MNLKKNGTLLVLSGPSGSGKNTVLDALIARDDAVCQTVSATTRSPRSGEREGVDYYFVSREDFFRRIEAGDFVEYNQYGENFYGTLRSEIERLLDVGKKVILVIDVNGAANIKKIYPDSVSVFLMPPSDDVLCKRICERGEMNPEELESRLRIALDEEKCRCNYDYTVVNDELDKAVDEVFSILCSIH